MLGQDVLLALSDSKIPVRTAVRNASLQLLGAQQCAGASLKRDELTLVANLMHASACNRGHENTLIQTLKKRAMRHRLPHHYRA